MRPIEATAPRSRIEQRRRVQILRAAAEVVAEEGFEGATMRKIAERAGVSAGMLNYFAAHTRLQGTGFTLKATAPSLVWLAASNFLIRVFSLGFLSAITEARSMRYMVTRLSCDGAIVWEKIAQNPDALLKRGEGLAEAFNVDAF